MTPQNPDPGHEREPSQTTPALPQVVVANAPQLPLHQQLITVGALAAVFAVAGGLTGTIVKFLYDYIRETDKQVAALQVSAERIEGKVNTLAQRVDNGFKRVDEKLAEMKERSDERHKELKSLLEKLTTAQKGRP